MSTPDPLKFAFSGKKSAHTHKASAPVPAELKQERFNQIMTVSSEPGKRLIYIHIPFCRTHCSYCGFFQNTTKADAIEQYVGYLEREIRMSAAAAWAQERPFHAVYFGGGTPTDLSPEQIIRLGTAIRESLPLANDVEMTFEGRFHGFDNDKIAACLEAGFNRFSLGAQSFQTHLRKSMSRIDSGEYLLERLEYLNSLDSAAVVIDLMYGLPGQTIDLWEKDLNTFLQSGVCGVDLYQLILMGHSRMKKSIEKGSMPEPASTPEKADMFRMGVEILSRAKVMRRSVNHWSKDTRERNFYNHYVKAGAEILPFGSGAGGNVGGYSLMSQRRLEEYYSDIDRGEKPIMMMAKASPDKVLHGFIGGGFDKGWLDLARLSQVAKNSLVEHCMPLFNGWQENGLASLDNNILELTLAGQFWNVTMNQALINYLEQYPLRENAA